MLYIGSCRYMEGYPWDFFPARLHTTREILFFLKNIDGIHALLERYPKGLRGKIFGDLYHPDVIEKSKAFMNRKVSKNIGKLILEISSRTVCYYKDTPLNEFYIRDNEPLIRNYKLISKELSDIEIEKDIYEIYEISKKIFNETIELHIIPHLNLKSKALGTYIPKRNSLVLLLESICNTLHIQFHPIGVYLEKIDGSLYIEDYMKDSTHYSNGYDKVKEYLLTNAAAASVCDLPSYLHSAQ